MGFLGELSTYIAKHETEKVLRLVMDNQNTDVSDIAINAMFCALSPVSKEHCDIHLSGMGGSGVVKPNLTTLTAFYLSKCGIDVIKTGSKKRTGTNGSTEFMQEMRNLYPSRFANVPFRYYDVQESAPWLEYRTLLCLNHSFERFFRLNIYDEVHSKCKYVGIRSPDFRKDRLSKAHTIDSTNEHTFCTRINNRWIDEIVCGEVHFDEKIIIQENDFFPLSESDVVEVNRRLFLGDDHASFWYNSLKLSISLILQDYYNYSITKYKAQELFLSAYN